MREGGTSETFVARLWVECEPDQEPVWRGHVRHVQSSRECYFQNLDDMRGFLEEVSGVPCPPSARNGETPAASMPPDAAREPRDG